MKKTNTLVSVIMNCYNGEKYLLESIQSVLDQTYKNWELIFWDNKSKDNSKKLFRSIKDTRLKYYCSRINCSLYKARNLAIKKCKGEFIAFIDVDDKWFKNKLEVQIKKFKNKKIGLVYSNLYLLNDKKKTIKIFSQKKLPEGDITSKLLRNYSLSILTTVIRKNLLKKFKLNFDKKYKIIGDFDLFVKLTKKTKVSCSQEPLAYYRLHDNNLSKKLNNTWVNELYYWVKQNQKLFDKKDITYLKQYIHYLKVKNIILRKNIYKSFISIFNFPIRIYKIKLLFFLIKNIY
jgi:glycosyltransferase involved in cell wall biosynthesis